MNDEQVLKRKRQRFIVESDSDDDNQMIDLKDEEICQCFLHQQDTGWPRSCVPVLRWSCELQSALWFILVQAFS
jgi:hypothetical protein